MLWSAGDLVLSLLQMSSFLSFSWDYSWDACDLWLRQEWDERVPCLNCCIESWLHWSGGKQLHPGPCDDAIWCRFVAGWPRTKQSTDLVWSQSLPTLRPAAMSHDELQSSSFAMKESEVWGVPVGVEISVQQPSPGCTLLIVLILGRNSFQLVYSLLAWQHCNVITACWIILCPGIAKATSWEALACAFLGIHLTRESVSSAATRLKWVFA